MVHFKLDVQALLATLKGQNLLNISSNLHIYMLRFLNTQENCPYYRFDFFEHSSF